MKNTIAIVLFVGFGVLATGVQASDWDYEFYESRIKPQYRDLQRTQQKRATLLDAIERRPDDYESLLNLRDALVQKTDYEIGGGRYMPESQIPWEINRLNNFFFPGVLPYVKKSLGVKDDRFFSTLPQVVKKPLPDIKEHVRRKFERDSISYRLKNWISSKWYRTMR